jgi:hypothetical protein
MMMILQHRRTPENKDKLVLFLFLLFFLFVFITYRFFSLGAIRTNDFGDFDDFGVMMMTSSMVTASAGFWE